MSTLPPELDPTTGLEAAQQRFTARQCVLCVFVCALLLLICAGGSIRHAGEEMQPGAWRTILLAVGRPAAWGAEALPVADTVNRATRFLSPDADGGKGFATATQTSVRGVPPVTPNAFDPADVGERPVRPRTLRSVLITGDSLATPLDIELARRLAGVRGVQAFREPHLGTGISKSAFVDWGTLSARQVRKRRPEAIVVFIGANEGFPMPGPGGRNVVCCGRVWAAAYAARARQMMATYRQDGVARVYWLTVPVPRDHDRARITQSVNAAVRVAAEPYRAQVRILDMGRIFTPRGRYRSSMVVGGREVIVREPDGIHLNETGAGVAADAVRGAIRRDFGR